MVGEDFDHDREPVAKRVHHAEPKLALDARVLASSLEQMAGHDPIARVDLVLDHDVVAERVPVVAGGPVARPGGPPTTSAQCRSSPWSQPAYVAGGSAPRSDDDGVERSRRARDRPTGAGAPEVEQAQVL